MFKVLIKLIESSSFDISKAQNTLGYEVKDSSLEIANSQIDGSLSMLARIMLYPFL